MENQDKMATEPVTSPTSQDAEESGVKSVRASLTPQSPTITAANESLLEAANPINTTGSFVPLTSNSSNMPSLTKALGVLSLPSGSTTTPVTSPSGATNNITNNNNNNISNIAKIDLSPTNPNNNVSSTPAFSPPLCSPSNYSVSSARFTGRSGSQPYNGSSESLNRSPHSPGLDEHSETTALSYKAQRKNYRREKLRAAKELSLALKDPSIIILSGILKVRGKLKTWTKLWAVLKPGLLILYKGKEKSSHWVATALLSCCKVIERPSKKDGFCFKLFHPLEQSIWATRGPNGESLGSVVQPLPTTYLICRAPSADEGKCWMDGLELALTCSSLLVRTPRHSDAMDDRQSGEQEHEIEWGASDVEEMNRSRSASETDSHDQEHDSDVSTDLHPEPGHSRSLNSSSRRTKKDGKSTGVEIREYEEDEDACTSIATVYEWHPEEAFSHARGEHSEELADENKSLLWFLLKQVRPGMDLSRVVLPTFILEPRSFLDKLSDYYYHVDLLSNAVLEDDPYKRMKQVVKWYFSGFYKKPRGLKKPYNPILGENFRCYYEHENGSKTFYLAEQVSHHPPISAFYVSNKKDGFVISGGILAKSRFYGNSTSALLDGSATLTMLPRGEEYTITMPYAHCKGILLGTLSMELGGEVSIVCEKTGYFTDIEFKLKGFLSRSDSSNAISGKIKLGQDTIAYLDGHWDSKITLREKISGKEEVFWEVTEAVRSRRLKRYTVPLANQLTSESQKKWLKVTEAILRENQDAATAEKTVLEERQREEANRRNKAGIEYRPNLFTYDIVTDKWRYIHADLTPWDDGNDLLEYETDFCIKVQKRHRTPIMRTGSLVSVDAVRREMIEGSSEDVLPSYQQRESNRQLLDLLKQLLAQQIQQSEQIKELRTSVTNIQAKLARQTAKKEPFPLTSTISAVVLAVGLQLLVILFWFGDDKLLPDISFRK